MHTLLHTRCAFLVIHAHSAFLIIHTFFFFSLFTHGLLFLSSVYSFLFSRSAHTCNRQQSETGTLTVIHTHVANTLSYDQLSLSLALEATTPHHTYSSINHAQACIVM